MKKGKEKKSHENKKASIIKKDLMIRTLVIDDEYFTNRYIEGREKLISKIAISP